MKRCRAFILISCFLTAAHMLASTSDAAPALKKVRASYSTLAYANPPFWIAKDLGLFEKYGLDVELSHVGGEKGIPAMIGGSLDVVQIGGTATVTAAVQGMDVVILGTFFNRLVFAVHASDQIKDIKDLRGKTIGTGSIGGNSYFAGLVLLSHLGWTLNKDATLLSVGGDPETLMALQQGKFQAGIMSPPTTYAALKAGFREIFNISNLNLPFPTISVVSTRKYIQENPETVLNVLRASSEATYLYKTRPDLVMPVIAKYMRVSKNEPDLLQSHNVYGKYMNETLTVPLDGVKFILNNLSDRLNRPDLKTKNPADFVDSRFTQKLEQEGFFKKLSQTK
jgi:NitT/TauT family transport system substrate-binding protein